MQDEVEAALKMGLPASFTTTTPLPFAVKGAIRFDNQAQFHPRRFLLALAADIPGGGSHLFEQTLVTGVEDGEPCVVSTARGRIRADAVVVASHFPVADKARYAERMQPHRSYVLALRVAEPLRAGVFISAEPFHSTRSYPAPGSELIFVGGEGHRTGEGGATVARYRRLEQWARERFAVRSIEYHWSTQDNLTPDGAPYIGLYGPEARHCYVATGFNGWGMAHGAVAGMLLRDLILGRRNPWTAVFDPNRADPAEPATDSAEPSDGAAAPRVDIDAIAPGEGAIVTAPQGEVAVYKAPDGTLHRRSASCTHMGCSVAWNSAEQSWDCPCHGSRFGIDGKVLHGPAIEPLPAASA